MLLCIASIVIGYFIVVVMILGYTPSRRFDDMLLLIKRVTAYIFGVGFILAASLTSIWTFIIALIGISIITYCSIKLHEFKVFNGYEKLYEKEFEVVEE